jgi:hypothetical protein
MAVIDIVGRSSLDLVVVAVAVVAQRHLLHINLRFFLSLFIGEQFPMGRIDGYCHRYL